MGFRFHGSTRLGPLRFHFSRSGLSWSVDHSPDRPPHSRQALLDVLHKELFAPDSMGEQLWDHGLVSRLLADGSIGTRTVGLLALIETPEAMEGYPCCGRMVRTMSSRRLLRSSDAAPSASLCLDGGVASCPAASRELGC